MPHTPITLEAAIDPILLPPPSPSESSAPQPTTYAPASSNSPGPSRPVTAPKSTQSASEPGSSAKPAAPVRELTASGKPKRIRRPLPPGSAADFKRREANRKAAERSRSRAAEKVQAVKDAFKALSAENEALIAEIRQLEGTADGSEYDERDVPRDSRQGGMDHQGRQRDMEMGLEHQEVEAQAQIEAAIAVAQQEMAATRSRGIGVGVNLGGADLDGDADAARERDERSILAALMESGINIPGMELDEFGPDPDDGVWHHHSDSMGRAGEGEVEIAIEDAQVPAAAPGSGSKSGSDSTSGGRLGELAAVATDPHPASSSSNTSGPQALRGKDEAGTPLHERGQSSDPDRKGGALDPGLSAQNSRSLEFQYIPAEAAAATASAVAVALHAELEKTIRDEVALTRVAILQVEQQIAKLREHDQGGGVTLILEELGGPHTLGDMLPPQLVSEEEEAGGAAVRLTAETTTQAEEISVGLEGLRGSVEVAQQAKLEEEKRVSDVTGQLYTIALASDSGERGRIMQLLKGIKGYIGNLIWVLDDTVNPDDTLLGTAYSTPAIARRRRGRPPKNSWPLRYNHAELIYPTLPLDPPVVPGTGAPPPKRVHKPKIKPVKVPSKRIVRGRRAEGDNSVVYVTTAPAPLKDLTPAQAQAQAQGQGPEQGGGPTGEANLAEHASNHDGDADKDSAEKVGEYIISHLQAANKANAESAALALPLDTAEAHVIPTTAPVSSGIGVGVGIGIGVGAGLASNTPASAFTLTHTPALSSDLADSAHLGEVRIIRVPDPAFQSAEWTENALSRLRKGPTGSCEICARTETSVWRKLVLGGEDYRVCNACGLYHRKFGVVRPPSLWGDGESLKKRRAGRAISDDNGAGRRKKKARVKGEDANVGDDTQAIDLDLVIPDIPSPAVGHGSPAGEETDADLALLVPALVSPMDQGRPGAAGLTGQASAEEQAARQIASGVEGDESAPGGMQAQAGQDPQEEHGQQHEHEHDPTGLLELDDELRQFGGEGMDDVFAELQRAL